MDTSLEETYSHLGSIAHLPVWLIQGKNDDEALGYKEEPINAPNATVVGLQAAKNTNVQLLEVDRTHVGLSDWWVSEGGQILDWFMEHRKGCASPMARRLG